MRKDCVTDGKKRKGERLQLASGNINNIPNSGIELFSIR
jgi:hypothetical protein